MMPSVPEDVVKKSDLEGLATQSDVNSLKDRISSLEEGQNAILEELEVEIARISVTSINVPSEVTVGQTVDVSAIVTNTGGKEGSKTIDFIVDGETMDSQEVTVGPGETKTLTFQITKDEEDTYNLSVGGASATLTVVAAGPGEGGRIGLILATGGLGDRSFNDTSYWGAQRAAEEFDRELDYVEPQEIAEYEGHQRSFAEAGEYDIIACIGFDQADILDNVAKDYPEQDFAVVDAVAQGDNNIASLLFNDWEEAFLCGVVAGEMTETNKVGIEGGMDIPLINRFVYGFRQGVLWANPQMDNEDVLVRYVGAWNDITTGKSLAETMYNEGADIIYGAAGKSHLGVFQAAEEEADLWAIGTDVDQAWSAPEHADVILASGLKRVDLAVYNQIERAVNNNFEPGIISYGMGPDADVGYGTGIAVGDENINEYIRASYSEVDIPESVIESVEDAVEGIRSGEIEIEHP